MSKCNVNVTIQWLWCQTHIWVSWMSSIIYRKTSNKRPGGNKFLTCLDPAAIGDRRLLEVYYERLFQI